MSLELSSEQDQVVAATAELLRARLPVTRLRGLGGAPAAAVPAALWGEIAAAGWFGLGLAESKGGVGYSVAEEALVALELGRQLAPPSITATVLATRLAAYAGQYELVAQFTRGDARAGFAIQLPTRCDGDTSAASDEAAARNRWLLVDADDASHVLHLGGETSELLQVAAGSSGDRVACLDESVPLRDWVDPRPATAVIMPERAEEFHAAAELLVAATLCGMSQAAGGMAARYAGERQQFGRPIGAFQATKHRCARMALRAEAASSHCRHAAVELAADAPGGPLAAAQAYWLAVAAAEANAADNIQVHGGMGFTAEIEAHLYVKRTWLLRLLLPPAAQVRARILQALVSDDARAWRPLDLT